MQQPSEQAEIEKKAKEKAAEYELADLLDMNTSSKVNG